MIAQQGFTVTRLRPFMTNFYLSLPSCVRFDSPAYIAKDVHIHLLSLCSVQSPDCGIPTLRRVAAYLARSVSIRGDGRTRRPVERHADFLLDRTREDNGTYGTLAGFTDELYTTLHNQS